MRAVYGDPLLERFFHYPEESLGIKFEFHSEIAPHISRASYISIHSARSESGQAALWRTVRHHHYRGRLITEPIDLPVLNSLQHVVLSEITDQIGSALFRFEETGSLIDITRGIQRESMWSLDQAETSQIENEIRAQLDLPLGSIESTHAWIAGEFEAPHHLDMVHPFRHLFARQPTLKFHRFKTHSGFITLSGARASLEEMYHAIDYLEGVINE